MMTELLALITEFALSSSGEVPIEARIAAQASRACAQVAPGDRQQREAQSA